jgi:hypothetical protein
MKTNAIRFAGGLALVAFGAPFPASGQYFPPALIIVPPPAQNYATPPKPVPRSPPAAKPKPADAPEATSQPAGHYQGRTFVPD